MAFPCTGFSIGTPPGFDADIRRALDQKRLIEIDYEGKRKIVEPHDYIVHRGIFRLLAYQIRGATSSRLPGWRDLDLGKVTRLVVLDEAFAGSRGDEYPQHRRWDIVLARVKP